MRVGRIISEGFSQHFQVARVPTVGLRVVRVPRPLYTRLGEVPPKQLRRTVPPYQLLVQPVLKIQIRRKRHEPVEVPRSQPVAVRDVHGEGGVVEVEACFI